jgi:hypothetical protein
VKICSPGFVRGFQKVGQEKHKTIVALPLVFSTIKLGRDIVMMQQNNVSVLNSYQLLDPTNGQMVMDRP